MRVVVSERFQLQLSCLGAHFVEDALLEDVHNVAFRISRTPKFSLCVFQLLQIFLFKVLESLVFVLHFADFQRPLGPPLLLKLLKLVFFLLFLFACFLSVSYYFEFGLLIYLNLFFLLFLNGLTQSHLHGFHLFVLLAFGEEPVGCCVLYVFLHLHTLILILYNFHLVLHLLFRQ